MRKKYKLIRSDLEGLFRIVALRTFSDVKSGDIGGYVQSESNLSHEGSCWVYGNAIVCGNAKIIGHANVYSRAAVSGNAWVWGNAWIKGSAWVGGNARVSGNAIVRDNAKIHGNAMVTGNSIVTNYAKVRGDAVIKQKMHVKYYVTEVDLEKNLAASIAVQTGIRVCSNDIFYAHTPVNEDLTSDHDKSFQYCLGRTKRTKNPNLTNKSCASGIHVSCADYWNNQDPPKMLLCECNLNDVVTVQEGKIRMKAVKPIKVMSKNVF